MTRDDWKQTLVLTLVLGLVTLAIWVIRFEVQLTPSQARALASMHVFVGITALVGAAFTIGSLIASRRESREAPQVRDKADPSERVEPEPSVPVQIDLPPAERWLTLIASDAQVRSAAEQLSTYGIKWVAALGHEFMDAAEDRTRLPAIVKRLRSEAEREDEEREKHERQEQERLEQERQKQAREEQARKKQEREEKAREARELEARMRHEQQRQKQLQEEQQWAAAFSVTAEGERVTPEALAILKLAKVAGYDLSVDTDGAIIAHAGATTSYLHSISDIMLFSKNCLAA